MAEDKNYVCSLEKIYVDKAKNELFEVPADRLAAVAAFRTWIKEQPHIRCPQTDTLFLLTFLRWAKWSQIRARERIQGFLQMADSVPTMMKNLDPLDHKVMDVFKAGYIYVPKAKTDKGEQVIILQLECLNTLPYDMTEFLRACSLAMFQIFHDEMNQVNGLVYFIDYKNLNTTGLKKIISPNSQKVFKALMNTIPGRWKNIIYYRAGLLFEVVVGFLKPLIPKKVYERISLHETMSTVYPIVPKQCLPVEYLPDDYKGPNAGTLQQLKDDMIRQMTEKKFMEHVKYITSDSFGVDNSKKPVEVVNAHFRKLNVD